MYISFILGVNRAVQYSSELCSSKPYVITQGNGSMDAKSWLLDYLHQLQGTLTSSRLYALSEFFAQALE